MPYEIFAIPVLVCFIIGFIKGKRSQQSVEDNSNY